MANRNPICRLPKWARRAFRDVRPHAPAFGWLRDSDAVAQHKRLVRRVAARWLEMEQGVLPFIGGLSDWGKRLFLWRALEVSQDADRNHLGKTRQAGVELRRLHDEIQNTTDRLKSLLAQVTTLRNDYGYSYPYIDLLDCIGDAMERYPQWSRVIDDEWRKFSIVARNQSRAGPDLSDILESYLMLSHGGADQIQPPSGFSPAIASRQAGSKNNPDGADKLRLLILELNISLPGSKVVHIPSDFQLPAPAMAVLADVIFDWEPGTVMPKNVDKHQDSLLDQKKRSE